MKRILLIPVILAVASILGAALPLSALCSTANIISSIFSSATGWSETGPAAFWESILFPSNGVAAH